jgi:hypothetical protein
MARKNSWNRKITFQPFIVHLNDENTNQYFIKMALDIYYKLFHVFNIEYDEKTKHVFEFLEMIYGNNNRKSPTIKILFEKIKSVN